VHGASFERYLLHVLHGRGGERALVERLVDAACAGSGGAMLLHGDPGTGKSTLLDAVASSVDGVTVLHTQGIESEAPLAFAALQRLLRPLMAHAATLPLPQAQALRVAFGEEPGEADRFLVFLGALSLLAEASEQRPVLAIVDDAHWLDDASAAALLFVARRLQVEHVAMIFAARDGDVRKFEAPDVDAVHLVGLDLAAATALLSDQAGVAVSVEVTAQLLASTGGNPLALVELPHVLTADQLAGRSPLPGRLPVTGAVERVFLDRARRLSRASQRVLLIAAVDDSTEVQTVLRAARTVGAGPEHLAEAETSGLVRVEGRHLRLRHPLVRSAVYTAATTLDRRQAHAALAEAMAGVDDADRRAWHRAAAIDVPDESVVVELDAAAVRAEQRGGHEAASAAWERSAELSEDADERSRRLYGAARAAWLAGQPARARSLVDAARALGEDAMLLADILRLRARIEWNTGSVLLGHRMVLEAARDIAPVDPARAREMAMFAAALAAFGWDSGVDIDAVSFAPVTATHARVRDRCFGELLTGLVHVTAGDWKAANESLQEAFELGDALELGDQDLLPNLGIAALHIGDTHRFETYHQQLLTRARNTGAEVMVLYALTRLGFSDVVTGQWTTMAARQEEALALGRRTGQQVLAAGPAAWLTLLAALRGEDSFDERQRALQDALEAQEAGILDALIRDVGRWAKGVAVGPRNPASFHHFAQLAQPISRRAAAIDRLESAVCAEQLETARVWIEDLEAFAAATGQRWAAACAAHGSAVLAVGLGEDRARHWFEEALCLHEGSEHRFNVARTQLAFGEHLRRSRQRVAAREQLRTALAAFEDLRAAPWAERAASELRASGESARKRSAGTMTALTPQELQVAQLVQKGLSNREVAGQLFVSPRTVDFHLRNVFAKTGVASRTELAQLALA
jgi:DNA-binding CsgD family transcriptional regulator